MWHGEPHVPHEIIVEMMIESTSSSSNIHEVVDDNMNMIMDAMRMIRVMPINVQ
jgi:hypothetical protein